MPSVGAIASDYVEVAFNGVRTKLHEGEAVGNWSLMGVLTNNAGRRCVVFEDFSTNMGSILLVDGAGQIQILEKFLEPTFAEPSSLYRGHTLKEVLDSERDLLGSEILAQTNEPSFEEVSRCFAPITKMSTYTFVGTRESSDKIGISYGGSTANFDPAVYVPAIRKIRDSGRVLDGLIGGWLPVLRFVYPEQTGDWSELVLFAPPRTDNSNLRFQPVWYRVCRIEGGKLKWAKYFDSYHPFPPRTESGPSDFYQGLLETRGYWRDALASGMQIELPDKRLENLARHSLVRALITRMGQFPKYGVMDRSYGGAEHDGFQDTFNVDTTAMLEWGLPNVARDYIDNYFTYFVRDDGSILYRGPETGQYGRMLTVIAEYAAYSGDAKLLLKHRGRIDAVTRLLLTLRSKAKTLAHNDPAYGMIAGWCEADACLDPEPTRYMQPYFSNSSEAARGFGDLGKVWEGVGGKMHDSKLAAWGSKLRQAANELNSDMQTAIRRSLLTNVQPICLPTIAGVKEPFDVVVPRDSADPQFRAYRANMEMLYSGNLTRDEVEMIVNYREAHRDILLGVPAAYGYNSREMAGFLSYGHAFGLLQHDLVREFLLEVYSLSAHQYTRGSWTAPETRRINPAKVIAPYCVPAQLAIPLMVRWLLAFESPSANEIWLCKAAPRDCFKDGSRIAASAIPTRSGKLSFAVESHISNLEVDAQLELEKKFERDKLYLRLRVPGNRQIASVLLNGKLWTDFDSANETITIPAVALKRVALKVSYR